MKRFRYYREAAIVWVLLRLAQLIPIDIASWIGAKLMRLVGPTLKPQRTAEANIRRFMPHLSAAEQKELVLRMWEHIGRVGAEIVHLPGRRLTSRIDLRGLENIPKEGARAIFISGHIGQWELTYPIAFDRGIPLTLIYRHANNPFVDRMICKLRASHATDMFPKGRRGAHQLTRALKGNTSLAMLVDQKMNDGIPIPFFGADAMTAPAVAQFALRFNLPIIPARVVRTRGVHFKGEILPPMQFALTGDTEEDVKIIMRDINALLERWIRETPDQWLWLHKRWPDA